MEWFNILIYHFQVNKKFIQMKKLIVLILALAYMSISCRVIKTNDIYVDHAKEKDHFKVANKKPGPGKKCNNSWK